MRSRVIFHCSDLATRVVALQEEKRHLNSSDIDHSGVESGVGSGVDSGMDSGVDSGIYILTSTRTLSCKQLLGNKIEIMSRRLSAWCYPLTHGQNACISSTQSPIVLHT